MILFLVFILSLGVFALGVLLFTAGMMKSGTGEPNRLGAWGFILCVAGAVGTVGTVAVAIRDLLGWLL